MPNPQKKAPPKAGGGKTRPELNMMLVNDPLQHLFCKYCNQPVTTDNDLFTYDYDDKDEPINEGWECSNCTTLLSSEDDNVQETAVTEAPTIVIPPLSNYLTVDLEDDKMAAFRIFYGNLSVEILKYELETMPDTAPIRIFEKALSGIIEIMKKRQ